MISKKNNATVMTRLGTATAAASSVLWNPESRTQPIGWASAVISVGLAALWGGNIVALKVGLHTFPPFWSALWRMATGLLVVGLWARWRRIPLKPQPGEFGFLLVLGLLFTAQISALNIGMNMTSPAYGAVLLNSHPIFANFIGHFVVKEDRLSWPRLCGLALAFGGICVVFLGKPGADLASRPTLGNLVVTLAGFMIGLTTVYTQRLVQTIAPERPVFWQMLICLPFFLLGGVHWEPLVLRQVSTEAVFAIVYQGAVIAGFCFIVWTELLTRHSPGSLSIFAFPTPIFGLLASAWFYGEAVTPRLWLGMAAITLGILIATRCRRGAAPPPEFRGTA